MSKLEHYDNLEIKYILDILDRDPTYKYLKYKKDFSFSVGDVLIKRINKSFGPDPLWEYEAVSGLSNHMLKRYMYVYEDPETGIGFIKQMKINGEGLGKLLIPMTNFDYDYVRFEVDPVFLDSILLGDGSFDIKTLAKAEKQRKEEVIDFNKTIAHPSSKCSEINSFISSLKVGSEFHSSWNAPHNTYQGRYVTTYKMLSLKKIYISNLPFDQRSHFLPEISNKTICDTKVVYIIEVSTPWNHSMIFNTFDFIGRELYASKPRNITLSEK